MYENGTFYIESGAYIKRKLDSATCIRGRVTDKGVVDFRGAIWISARLFQQRYALRSVRDSFFFARLEYYKFL